MWGLECQVEKWLLMNLMMTCCHLNLHFKLNSTLLLFEPLSPTLFLQCSQPLLLHLGLWSTSLYPLASFTICTLSTAASTSPTDCVSFSWGVASEFSSLPTHAQYRHISLHVQYKLPGMKWLQMGGVQVSHSVSPQCPCACIMLTHQAQTFLLSSK